MEKRSSKVAEKCFILEMGTSKAPCKRDGKNSPDRKQGGFNRTNVLKVLFIFCIITESSEKKRICNGGDSKVLAFVSSSLQMISEGKSVQTFQVWQLNQKTEVFATGSSLNPIQGSGNHLVSKHFPGWGRFQERGGMKEEPAETPVLKRIPSSGKKVSLEGCPLGCFRVQDASRKDRMSGRVSQSNYNKFVRRQIHLP